MSIVTITVELPDPTAWDLAQFIKRVRFDQCYELTDCGQSRAEREDQAYRMINGLNKVADALGDAGYAPR